MFRRISLLVGFACLFLLASTVYAQGPVVQHSDPVWQVSYWNNTTLAGDPVLQETHTQIEWEWRTGSPHPNVNADRWSARWERHIEFQAGTYRFFATADDGIRVYVDGRLLIDGWYDHPARTFTANVDLEAGHHLIVVEYYENAGHAVAKLSWVVLPTTNDNWLGEYFNNRTLSGLPALVRETARVDFHWGFGSPAPVIPSDGFSVRWIRVAEFQAGTYRFTATSDDGIRVYVDNRLILDHWYDHPVRTFTADASVVAGPHLVIVEFYENTGHAVAQVSWAPTPSTPNNWRGEYFNNSWLGGSPFLVRDDEEIDFYWGYSAPAPGIPGDGFSVRWTGTANFGTGGLYRFTASTDDGVRLWVNGHLLIDNWRDQPFSSRSGTIHVAGDVNIKMEYYENLEVAGARLTWVRVDGDTSAIIVDDTDPGFVKGGSATGWRTDAAGHGGHLTWTQNNNWPRYKYNWARWYPSLATGRYEVLVYIPDRYSTTSKARYWVSHRDGFALRIVDQSAYSNRWVSLGTYWFRGTRQDYVSLADATYEPYLSRLIAFDAAKWEPR
jgi:hypothetical protein